MKIVLTGGGSGGHITPLLAVASELKKYNPDLKLIYIGQKGDSLADIAANDGSIDESYSVRAGKFRRYHREGLKQLIDFATIIKNARDSIYVVIGLIQSYLLIKKLKPDLVFSKGGFVSVPVCLGAKLNGVNYITHDSDPIPGLANRIISPWAKLHLVAVDKDLYPYPEAKTITTGIPVNENIKPVSKEVKAEYRQKLNISPKDKLIFVIGGGLGAKSLNDAMHEILPNLMAEFKDLRVVHIVGRKNIDQAKDVYSEVLSEDQQDRLEVIDYTNRAYLYSGAADIVVTRAGATSLAEFEIQGVPCIVVPGTFLVAGQQLKNAKLLTDNDAAVVISDTDLAENPHILSKQISQLLKDSRKRHELAERLASLGHPHAAKTIAKLIIDASETKK